MSDILKGALLLIGTIAFLFVGCIAVSAGLCFPWLYGNNGVAGAFITFLGGMCITGGVVLGFIAEYVWDNAWDII